MIKELRRRSSAIFRRKSTVQVSNLPSQQDDDAPLFGVNLRLLHRLLELQSAENPEMTSLTLDVVEAHIKPATEADQISLANLFAKKYTENRHPTLDLCFGDCFSEKASVYVIHAWSYNFKDLVAALEDYARNNKGIKSIYDVYFWLDFAVFSQWKTIERSWFKESLHKIMKVIGKTCLVLMPWKSPIPYRRCWCLMELFISSLANCKLQFQLSAKRHSHFMQMIVDNFDTAKGVVNRMIQVQSATCSNSRQKEMIISVLNEMHENGVFGVNEIIEKYLSDSLTDLAIKCIKRKLESIRNEIRELRNEDNSDDDESDNEVDNNPTNSNNNINQRNNQHSDNNRIRNTGEIGDIESNNRNANENQRIRNRLKKYQNKSMLSKFFNVELCFQALGIKDFRNIDADLERLQVQEIIHLTSLATLYTEKGLIESAEELYKSVIEDRERMLGENHPSLLSVYNNMAVLEKRLGRVHEAEMLYRRALRGKESELGEMHPSTSTTAGNLAAMLKQQHRIEESIEMFVRTLSDQEENLGEGHEDTVRTMENLVECYVELRKYSEARDLIERCIDRKAAIYGENHPETIYSKECFASLLVKLDDLETAHELLQETLQSNIEIHGEKHLITIDCCNRLAVLKWKLEKIEESKELFQRCLEVYIPTIGKLNPTTMFCFEALGDISLSLENVEFAEKYYREFYESSKIVNGSENSLDTFRGAFKLAEVLLSMDDFESAESLHHLAFIGRKQLLGENAIPTLESMFGYANALAAVFKFEDAKVLYEQTLHAFESTFGANHPHTLAATESLAAVCKAVGDVDSSEALYRHLIAYYQTHFGPEHTSTLYFVCALSDLYSKI